MMGCGTHGEGNHDSKLDNGLSKSHAYSILDAKFLYDKDDKPIRAFLLRNPWAGENFSGKFSDQDKEFWTRNTLRNNGHELLNDGVFWITVEEFKECMLYFVVT